MNGRLAYLDTSAFVKAPLGERDARALAAAADEWGMRASSAILRVEATRAAARVGTPAVEAVGAALRRVVLVPVDDEVLDIAAHVADPGVRSLDAIHLATALSLGDDLGVLLTYDARMAEAARSLGLPVESPA
ncbi:MAG: type II toxin-antitoxin system VapC family toxin [Acidobacteria bacterium]|nr:type II toxin-antitoxin system VapC family toxin [Acidobacteriota bacterium]